MLIEGRRPVLLAGSPVCFFLDLLNNKVSLFYIVRILVDNRGMYFAQYAYSMCWYADNYDILFTMYPNT